MKSFRSAALKRRVIGVALGCLAIAIAGRGAMPEWLQNVEARTAIEAALFRAVMMPGTAVMVKRPPRESREALSELLKQSPAKGELYSLRALEDEQQLDFAAAEADWKRYAETSPDKLAAQLSLADFYHRRLRPTDEITALSVVASAPPSATDKLTAETEQRQWKAFERIFQVISDQALGSEVAVRQYRAWIARYPRASSVYSNFLEYLIIHKNFGVAQEVIQQHADQFPEDRVFPVKAKARLEYARGSLREALAVYERAYEPLWDPELVQSYFDLLKDSRSLRAYLDNANAALTRNPDDLKAVTQIFYYYQQQGKTPEAQQAFTRYRAKKEARKAPWSANELFTFAKLLQDVHDYPEAARYYYALYNAKGMADAQPIALSGLAEILLTAPEQSVQFGSGDLSLYKDIGTMDTGPGFLNGILSLILNTQNPASKYSEEQQRAVPYFHRRAAAELVAKLEKEYPNYAARPKLHVMLLETYALYGQSDVVAIKGREFLSQFPSSGDRTKVSLLIADAFARLKKTQDEFAIYDEVLKELAAKADGVPLGDRAARNFVQQSAPVTDEEIEPEAEGGPTAPRQRGHERALSIQRATPNVIAGPRSQPYSQVLERYLSRLVALKRLPDALAVLRREIDRNPNDPGLYERLANFLEQNKLGTQEEETYRRAIQQFPDRSWYHKLARFYLRQKREGDFDKLTAEVVKIFQGSELEKYFRDVVPGTRPALFLRVNQYAHEKFPHNLTFVRNLITAYGTPQTVNSIERERLLRQYWFADDSIRREFFELLASSGRLQPELQSLEPNAGSQSEAYARENPAAARFVAEAEMWKSHFESAAPVLKGLSSDYPADIDLASRSAAVFRSLAAYDPGNTEIAAAIEANLAKFAPTESKILERIGDIYADRELIARAAPYWRRIPAIAPGKPDGYLEAATVFWDYYQFDDALQILNAGRKNLANADLFRYESGAIYEGKREYAAAIHEYVAGALASGEGGSESRLLRLARRPAYRGVIEKETAGLSSQRGVMLRVAVLEAQNRRGEVAQYLGPLIDGTQSVELVEAVEALAAQKSLEDVRQRALQKEVQLTTDPTHKLELRLALARVYESDGQMDQARATLESVYRESPKIMGVVRAMVDYYWRNGLRAQAVEVLQKASAESYADLRDGFELEAARKATEAGNYAQARSILQPLLQRSPFSVGYLAAMADTYSREGNDPGLRIFYLTTIDAFQKSSLDRDERTARVATLRRALIPALVRSKDFKGALDQYIELINRYPEDEGLTSEAAVFASKNGLKQDLTSYYQKTEAQSPRDYHWPLVLARLQLQFEDLAAAIDAYTRAMKIRPDRVDLRSARADLELRLIRFDDAAADYQRLYELAYHDPTWMDRLAETRARQGKTDETVKALQLALVEGRPQSAKNLFEVARRLESWNMLPQARDFAMRGADLAGDDLLANNDNHAGAETLARVLTRLREHELAWTRLTKAIKAAGEDSAVSDVVAEVEQRGLASVTDSEWRERRRQERLESSRQGMAASAVAMGKTVAEFFTPEEKARFNQFAEAQRAGMSRDEQAQVLIPLADAAMLPALEVSLREQQVMENESARYAHVQRIVDLQTRRLQFAELGKQLEGFYKRYPDDYNLLRQAAEAYAAAEDTDGEIRVLARLEASNSLTGPAVQRYFRVLLAAQPNQLIALAGLRKQLSNDAANYIVANGSAQQALLAVAARRLKLPAVWSKAYTTLVGLYFRENTPLIQASFQDLLGPSLIGEQLGNQVNRTQRLAGATWFYYGSRYGDYRGVTASADVEDYLPASVENMPGNADAYLVPAGYYVDSAKWTDAIREYEHALELNPLRPDVRNRNAIAYWNAGNHEQAIEQWKLAAEALKKQLDTRMPATFWNDFRGVVSEAGKHNAFAAIRPPIDEVLKTYVRRNGTYQSDQMLRTAFAASGKGDEAVKWMLEIAMVAPDPLSMLDQLANARWIPLASREPIHLKLIAIRKESLASAQGSQRTYATQGFMQSQLSYVRLLIDAKQFDRAKKQLESLPEEQRRTFAEQVVPLQVRLAAQEKTIDALLASYAADTEHPVPADALRRGAQELRDAGDEVSARRVLGFMYSREIADGHLTTANFIGLAEVKLQSGQAGDAMELLRRLVVVVGQPFENLDPAAALLEKYGKHAEAEEFLTQLVRAFSWNASYRVRLASATSIAHKGAGSGHETLESIAASSDAPYEVRTRAAALESGSNKNFGSAELNLLARSAPLTTTEAMQPWFYAAPLKVAKQTNDPAARIKLLGFALAYAPSRDDAQLLVFQAAVAAKRYDFALGAAKPLISKFGLQYYGGGSQSDESEEVGAVAPNASGELATAQTDSQNVTSLRVLPALALANEKTDRLDNAVSYLKRALALERRPAAKAQLRASIARVNRQIELKKANASRQPLFHDELEQDRVVRPRVLAVVPRTTAQAEGGAQ